MKIVIIITTKCFYENIHINYNKTLYHNRTEISKGLGADKANASKNCFLCHWLYFLEKGFKFQ